MLLPPLSGVSSEKPLGWGGQQSIFCLGFFLFLFSSSWDVTPQKFVLRGNLRLTSSGICKGSLFSPKL